MTLDQFFIWLNAAGAALAAVVNLMEGRQGLSQWSVLRYTIATLAACYAVGYVVLGLGWVDRLAWSHFFIGVAPAVWVIVWCGPPLRTWMVRHAVRREVCGE